MEKQFRITVIIPTRNVGKKIKRCLDAIFSQTFPPYEVIIVDGHSTDDTINIVKKFSVKILYENYGTRAGACQVGVENAKGEFIAFTDADCIPSKDWLENLIKEFDENENIVGIGGGIINIGDKFWEKSINLAYNTFLGSSFSVQGRLFKNRRFVKSISGCNSLYKKEDIMKIGGFNVKLPTAEDTEINRRLLKIGKLLYTPNAIVMHDHQRGIKEFAKRMFLYGYGRGKSRLWDLQVVPPIMIFFLFILSILINYLIMIIIIILYIIFLLAMGINFGIKKRDLKLIIAIPFIYLIEHTLYTIGIWRGFLSTVFQSGKY